VSATQAAANPYRGKLAQVLMAQAGSSPDGAFRILTKATVIVPHSHARAYVFQLTALPY
jgi:hypothetical protein